MRMATFRSKHTERRIGHRCLPRFSLRSGKRNDPLDRGRESFSDKASSLWLIVTRKRLPTPFALHATKANPTLPVLPVRSRFLALAERSLTATAVSPGRRLTHAIADLKFQADSAYDRTNL
jgi:hypothetical protein